MEISGLEDEFRLAAGKPMLLYLKRPAADQEPGLTAMIDGIRSAGAVSYRHFATAKELERLLTDDLAVCWVQPRFGTGPGRCAQGHRPARVPAAPGGSPSSRRESSPNAARSASLGWYPTDALVLLVTSRRLLDVRGERVYTLAPLPVPAEEAVTTAVELFLERARSIHPDHQPDQIHRLSDRPMTARGHGPHFWGMTSHLSSVSAQCLLIIHR
jgi:hypothetical protein